MSIYNPKNVLDKNPIQISGVVIAAVNVGVNFGLDVTVKQLGSINTLLVLGLGLFIADKTANKATLEAMKDSAEEPGPDPVEVG